MKYKNGEVLKLLTSNNLNENEKSAQLGKIGADFRVNVILEKKIQDNLNEIKSYQKDIVQMEKEQTGRRAKDNSSKTICLVP